MLLALANARPRNSPTAIIPRAAAAAPAPAATSASVGVVTLDYIIGSSTYKDVETYTDYGTELPDSYSTGVYSGDLPRVTDPCGPKVQDPYQPPTCNSPNGTETSASNVNSIEAFGYDADYVYQVDKPAPYGVQCLNSTTGNAAIDIKNCQLTAVDICRKIRSQYSPRGKWVWSTLGGPGCAMAYWLSPINGSAPAPLKDRCEDGIYNSMVDLCVTEPDGLLGVSNMAAVNIVQLPSAAGTGQQVNSGYPSYIVAAAPFP